MSRFVTVKLGKSKFLAILTHNFSKVVDSGSEEACVESRIHLCEGKWHWQGGICRDWNDRFAKGLCYLNKESSTDSVELNPRIHVFNLRQLVYKTQSKRRAFFTQSHLVMEKCGTSSISASFHFLLYLVVI